MFLECEGGMFLGLSHLGETSDVEAQFSTFFHWRFLQKLVTHYRTTI